MTTLFRFPSSISSRRLYGYILLIIIFLSFSRSQWQRSLLPASSSTCAANGGPPHGLLWTSHSQSRKSRSGMRAGRSHRMQSSGFMHLSNYNLTSSRIFTTAMAPHPGALLSPSKRTYSPIISRLHSKSPANRILHGGNLVAPRTPLECGSPGHWAGGSCARFRSKTDTSSLSSICGRYTLTLWHDPFNTFIGHSMNGVRLYSCAGPIHEATVTGTPAKLFSSYLAVPTSPTLLTRDSTPLIPPKSPKGGLALSRDGSLASPVRHDQVQNFGHPLFGGWIEVYVFLPFLRLRVPYHAIPELLSHT